eukprot:3885534-Rhodomonas_salina.1
MERLKVPRRSPTSESAPHCMNTAPRTPHVRQQSAHATSLQHAPQVKTHVAKSQAPLPVCAALDEHCRPLTAEQ